MSLGPVKRNPPERSILEEQQTKTAPPTNTAVTLSCAQSESIAGSHSNKLFRVLHKFFFRLKSALNNSASLAPPFSSVISSCQWQDSSLIASMLNLCTNKQKVDICSEVGQNQNFWVPRWHCKTMWHHRSIAAKDAWRLLFPSRR